MKSKKTIHRTLTWIALSLTLAVAACANLASRGPEDLVRERATERWQALVKGEFIRAYGYSTPGFKAVVSADGFRNRFGGAVTWLGAEVVKVNCDESNKCLARIRLEFRPALQVRKTEPMINYIDETWLLDQGQWWFYQKM